ncbi:putative GATA transcription factor 13 [Hirschfeldia incana]|nr:putative GATA transcription factor 13 [Hirschfeldia incana]
MNNGGSWLPEEDFKGLTDNFFDDLINQMDFPLEDIETTNEEGDWGADFKNLIPPPSDVLTSLSSEFTRGGTNTNGQRVGAEKKPVPTLKQSGGISSTVDTSLPDVKVSKLFQSSSPVSVLENNNAANGSASFQQNQNRAQRLAFPVKGIRSKRKRPTIPTFISLHSFLSEMLEKKFALDDADSDSEATYLSSESSAKKRRKKTNNTSYSPEPFSADGMVRKCTHCESTKTPQWREGPGGPKTLCNACGVRFRSGRLLPEYRPASSPTFIPTVHSNSHRKIIEMRRKDEEGQFVTGMPRGFRYRG